MCRVTKLLLSVLAVMGAANAVLWFDLVSGSYGPRFSVRQSLVLDAVNNVFNLYDLDGSLTQYSATTGAFMSHADVAGNTVAVLSYLQNYFNFSEVRRTTTTGGVTTVESFVYDYVDGSAHYPLLASVTLNRSVGGLPTTVNRVLYTYCRFQLTTFAS
jgi:hypothetical protein